MDRLLVTCAFWSLNPLGKSQVGSVLSEPGKLRPTFPGLPIPELRLGSHWTRISSRKDVADQNDILVLE